MCSDRQHNRRREAEELRVYNQFCAERSKSGLIFEIEMKCWFGTVPTSVFWKEGVCVWRCVCPQKYVQHKMTFMHLSPSPKV